MHANFLLSHFIPSKKIAAYEVALKSKKQIAEGTMAFIFERPNNFQFQAGQHVRMTLLDPRQTDRKGNRRFLTIASTPAEDELAFAMRMSETAFKRVLRDLPIREKVRIEVMRKSAHGSFVLHKDPSRPAVFLVGGIGIVPAYSIIKDALERKLLHRLVLLYSNRRPEDTPYLSELQALARRHPNFTFVATMTEPEQSAQSWHGETGYINEAILTRYVSDLQSPIYYIAGLTDMVRAMRDVLDGVGISDDAIRAEDFSDFKMQVMTRLPGSWQNALALLAVGLVGLFFVLVHAGTVVSLANVFTLKNVSVLTIGVLLVIVLLKIFAIVVLRHHVTQTKAQKE